MNPGPQTLIYSKSSQTKAGYVAHYWRHRQSNGSICEKACGEVGRHKSWHADKLHVSVNYSTFCSFCECGQGVRRLGAAAVDMCHVALGIVEAYWEYRLKPWDMAAGVLVCSPHTNSL